MIVVSCMNDMDERAFGIGCYAHSQGSIKKSICPNKQTNINHSLHMSDPMYAVYTENTADTIIGSHSKIVMIFRLCYSASDLSLFFFGNFFKTRAGC